ncbi:MAG TPA: glycosyltransferase family 39 protein [Verrucomicrobiae bacterium]|nr:glycosyltransferase family 39 protein [Verrucomicrobiae bacterium]
MVRPHRPALPKSFLWLLPLSFVLQLASIGALHQYRWRPGHDNFEFGWEMGRIGRSIALGHGFSSPYDGETGPSAWEPPLYPFLIGGVFKVFGVYTVTSAWMLLGINCVFATLTTIPIFWIAHRTFDRRVAVWSAWTWTLNPYVWYWGVHWIWDTTFTPFVLAWAFLLALELAEWPGVGGWILFGALYGVGALANPTMLAFLPFCGLWIWRERYQRGLASIGGVVLASLAFWIVLTPWLVRNYEVFRQFVFIRDDFGLQFGLGNGPSADGMLMPYFQPNLNLLELRKFQQMGELAYAAECKRFAFDWIRAHPGRFAVISLKRFFYYWNGVPRPTSSTSWVDFRSSAFLATSVLALWGMGRALRQKRRGAWLFAWLIFAYPAVYYFVFPHARYRHPIEPELLVLIVFLVSEAREFQKSGVAPDSL